jgi:hypothetical protein
VIIRRKKYTDESALSNLLARERLGFGRYRKIRDRDPEKRRVLVELALERIRETERSDYIPIGFRRRRVKV